MNLAHQLTLSSGFSYRHLTIDTVYSNLDMRLMRTKFKMYLGKERRKAKLMVLLNSGSRLEIWANSGNSYAVGKTQWVTVSCGGLQAHPKTNYLRFMQQGFALPILH
jgi:hypothetical protein